MKLTKLLSWIVVVLITSQLTDVRAQNTAESQAAVPKALDFPITMIHGDKAHLSRYHGQVIMIVNVASRCGLTKQYRELQALHEKYADQGLTILGVPANNFGGQEPGTNEQIQEFCSTRFNVEFDMLAKVSVKGDDITPLYAFLTGESTNPDFAGPIPWNFTKFLIDREGNVVARFSPRTKPMAQEVVEMIETQLKAPQPEKLSPAAIKWRKQQAAKDQTKS